MSDPIVVYVDDEPLLCRLFELNTQAQADWQVITFTKASEALEYLLHNQTSVVVCDYRMPEMTGVELLNRLTGEPPPFLLVTGDHSLDEVELDERVHRVVQKPFRYDELIVWIDELLE
jgi:DNA-binding NtrC family response regulator